MVVLPKPELRTKEKRCRTTEIRVIPVLKKILCKSGLKIEPVTGGKDATVYVWFIGHIQYTLQYRCNGSSLQQLSFYVKMQIIFGTM